jgi:hypothetical protein
MTISLLCFFQFVGGGVSGCAIGSGVLNFARLHFGGGVEWALEYTFGWSLGLLKYPSEVKHAQELPRLRGKSNAPPSFRLRCPIPLTSRVCALE